MQEIQSTGFAAGIDVRVNGVLGTSPYLEHFRPDTNSGALPLDFRVYADTSVGTPVDSSYVFEHISGEDILLIGAFPAASDPRIDLTSTTNHGDAGEIDVLLSGSITLTETVGDFQLTRIHSALGDIALTALTGGAQAVFVKSDAGSIALTTADQITANFVEAQTDIDILAGSGDIYAQYIHSPDRSRGSWLRRRRST